MIPNIDHTSHVMITKYKNPGCMDASWWVVMGISLNDQAGKAGKASFANLNYPLCLCPGARTLG